MIKGLDASTRYRGAYSVAAAALLGLAGLRGVQAPAQTPTPALQNSAPSGNRPVPTTTPPSIWSAGAYFPPAPPGWPADRIFPLIASVQPDRLREWHDLVAGEPHVAGTPGDQRQIERLVQAFSDMGLEVERHAIWVYLARPESASLEIVEPPPAQPRSIVLTERPLADDADSSHAELSWGWNAYAGSGEVTAEVVYANQGTQADFEQLRRLGIDLRGKIVLCRYGGNFRGYKAKYAEEAGAAGLVIFTDGGDGRVPTYPSGGAPNDTCIERGSINTLDYPGDPLTPGIAATREATRLPAEEVALPRIPVQPIGWGAAREILIRMAAANDAPSPGPAERPPLPEGWQSRIPVPHPLTSGPNLKLHLKVRQQRFLAETANVVATLRGTDHPDEYIIVGSHHDAWGFGACDPAAGTICTIEAARVFADAARNGRPPRRTLMFCCWGAEEFSIIGSTEWVESRREELTRRAIAYINLDMSAMGPHFNSAAAPMLKTLVTDVARHVPAVGAVLDPSSRTIVGPSVFDAWIARESDPALPGQPKFGDLGGGSDHVAFWCHAVVPSLSMGSGGAVGSAYHSIYDTLRWYRQNVGGDYQPARMVTQMVVATMARLADDGRVLCDWPRTLHDAAVRIRDVSSRYADSLGVERQERLSTLANQFSALAAANATPGPLVSDGALPALWMQPEGLPKRGWYRNAFAAPDATSGYAAWVLPELSGALESADPVAIDAAIDRLRERATRAERSLPAPLPARPAQGNAP